MLTDYHKVFMDYLRKQVIDEIGEVSELKIYFRPFLQRCGCEKAVTTIGLKFTVGDVVYGDSKEYPLESCDMSYMAEAMSEDIRKIARKVLRASKAGSPDTLVDAEQPGGGFVRLLC